MFPSEPSGLLRVHRLRNHNRCFRLHNSKIGIYYLVFFTINKLGVSNIARDIFIMICPAEFPAAMNIKS